MAVVGSTSDEDQLRRIEFVTDTSLAQLDVNDLLAELLGRVRTLLHADTAAVLLLDPATDELVATAAQGIEEEVRQGVRIPIGKGFAGRIAAERRAVVIEHVDHTNVMNPILREKHIRSLLGVPLIAEGAVIGVLHVGTLTPRRFTDHDAELLRLVADRIALVTRTRQSDLDRAAARALQRSLLPGRLPEVAGLRFAARYIPGDAGGLGGDWYDVFTLPSGRLGVVIGDVVGRGLHAAVVMGRLRSALRAFALEEDDPAEVLERLDRNVEHFEEGVMATVLYGIFEPSLEELSLSSAGHLPPFLGSGARPAAPVNIPVDLPVGVSVGPPRRTTKITLEAGSLLFLYTDGLVERRDRPLDTGLDMLGGALAVEGAESACAGAARGLIGTHDVPDDVAMLAVHRVDAGQLVPLALVLPATPRSLAEIRVALRRWLLSARASPAEVADVIVAVGEACSNVVEHAYGAGGGVVMLEVRLEGSDVVMSVRDHGRWRPPRGEGRGRGTALMHQCSERFDVATDRGGTTVTMTRRLEGRGP
jgi:anti-sigma regulatory factor (Ser/Thr protein kinase)/putative methionine-R-sulfoxide reductase with GAF domain